MIHWTFCHLTRYLESQQQWKLLKWLTQRLLTFDKTSTNTMTNSNFWPLSRHWTNYELQPNEISAFHELSELLQFVTSVIFKKKTPKWYDPRYETRTSDFLFVIGTDVIKLNEEERLMAKLVYFQATPFYKYISYGNLNWCSMS